MIITLLSYKGGTGKTTAAINLAGWLNQSAPTVLVDADANRSSLSWSQRGQLPFRVADEGEAAKVARQFEHIVLDTPARPSGAKLKGYADGADALILVVSPDALSIDAAIPAIADLKALKADFKVLVSMIRPNTSDDEAARAALERLGVKIFKQSIRQYIAARKAALDGVLVKDVNDPHANDLWADYGAIAKEILK